MTDELLKRVLIFISAFMLPLSARANDRVTIFTGEFLVRVVRSSQQGKHGTKIITSVKDGWHFQSLNEFGPNSISRQSIAKASEPVNEWYLVIPPERMQAITKPSYEGKTLGNGWEQAHDEIEKDFVSNRLSLRAKLMTEGIKVVAIEPNFAFQIKLQPERNLSITEGSERGNDQAQIVGGPNPAWPSKSIGWHLGDDYSQLASARRIVAERNHHQPRALIAHLDTG